MNNDNIKLSDESCEKLSNIMQYCPIFLETQTREYIRNLFESGFSTTSFYNNIYLNMYQYYIFVLHSFLVRTYKFYVDDKSLHILHKTKIIGKKIKDDLKVENIKHNMFNSLEKDSVKHLSYLLDFEKDTNFQKRHNEIFGEIKNKIQSGYALREIINIIDTIPFDNNKDKHELSSLYEDRIKNMGNTGRNGGEYYTPRPLIRTIIKTVQPKIGKKIYDGAVGSAGFLIEAYEYLKNNNKLSTSQFETLQKRTLYGKEKKPLPYIIATMNMILHGIETPNIIHKNTLTENVMDVEEKDKFDYIIANPPFGGKERAEVQQNFEIKSGETAYLFLQHFIKMLKAGGTAGIVIKNTFLSNDDAIELRKTLLQTCNLYAILDLPQ